MNEEEKSVLKLASNLGVHSSNAESVQAILSLAQAIRDQEAAKHKEEVEELERQVAGLRDAGSVYLECEDSWRSGHEVTDHEWLTKQNKFREALSDTSETAKRHDARVFEAGWRASSTWSGRSDLLSDIGSKAYLDAMAYELEGKK